MSAHSFDAVAAVLLIPIGSAALLASPVFGDFEGLAPLLIQVGSEETLLGDALVLAERAGQARVDVRLEVWPEMIHVWHFFGGQLGAARRAIRVAGDWMAEQTGA